MKKLLTILLLLLCLCAAAGAEEPTLWPAYDAETQLWGYIDETGAWAITPQYHQAYPFYSGCAVVDMAEEPHTRPPMQGLIDTTGAFLLPPEYYVYDEAGDTFFVMGFDEADEAIMGWYYAPTGFFTGLRWYACIAYSDGPYVKVDGGEPDRLCGLADRRTGEIVLPLEYSVTGLYDGTVEDGFVIAERADTGECELIELGVGAVALPEGAVIDYGEPVSEGLIVFEMDGKWGYLNTAGEIVIPAQYRYAESFQNGYANVGTWDAEDATAVIDRDGHVFLTITGDAWDVGACGMVGDMLRIHWSQDEWGLVRPDGTELCRFSAPEAWCVDLYAPTPDGPIWVAESVGDGDYEWRLLSREDWTLHSTGWKDYWVGGAPASLQPVEVSPGTWSYVDAYGETVISGVNGIYAYAFRGALARVTISECSEGYISREGELVFSWTYMDDAG